MAAIPVPPIVWALKKDLDILKKRVEVLELANNGEKERQ